MSELLIAASIEPAPNPVATQQCSFKEVTVQASRKVLPGTTVIAIATLQVVLTVAASLELSPLR
jgi:hypothetical protein